MTYKTSEGVAVLIMPMQSAHVLSVVVVASMNLAAFDRAGGGATGMAMETRTKPKMNPNVRIVVRM